jgi:hypothetical protein
MRGEVGSPRDCCAAPGADRELNSGRLGCSTLVLKCRVTLVLDTKAGQVPEAGLLMNQRAGIVTHSYWTGEESDVHEVRVWLAIYDP